MIPGIAELIVILVIVLLVFGHNKLPALGDAIGKSIKSFRRAARGADDIEVTPREGGGRDRLRSGEPPEDPDPPRPA